MLPAPYQDYPDPAATPTAGFLVRLGAYFVDLLILGPLTLATYFAMVKLPSLWLVVFISVLKALYKPLAEAHFGKTLGKHFFKLRIVDRTSGERMDFNQSFIRYLPFAVADFAYLFLLIRILQAPDFGEVADWGGYWTYMTEFPLNQNFIISLCGNLPLFSAVWMIMDPWKRALHDRWADTFVLRAHAVNSSG